VQPLLSELRSNPALGLFHDATYAQWSRPVRVGEVFLLLTDGVHEASNAAGEEFGFDRLWVALKDSLGRTPGEIGQAVVAELHRFVEPEPLADDICLVTVEIGAAPAKLANVAEAQAANL
jgi:sigma-B regulation protein RsbU (phosphoserine phosphatase)